MQAISAARARQIKQMPQKSNASTVRNKTQPSIVRTGSSTTSSVGHSHTPQRKLPQSAIKLYQQAKARETTARKNEALAKQKGNRHVAATVARNSRHVCTWYTIQAVKSRISSLG